MELDLATTAPPARASRGTYIAGVKGIPPGVPFVVLGVLDSRTGLRYARAMHTKKPTPKPPKPPGTCSYRDCTRVARPNWTTCGRHYSAGRNTKVR